MADKRNGSTKRASRRGDEKSGSIGERKRPRYQSSPWSSSLSAVRNGQAILFTCDVGREAKAAKELSIVLERYAEDARSPSGGPLGGASDKDPTFPVGTENVTLASGDEGAGEGTIRDTLEQEIADLKEKTKSGARSTMVPIETGCRGTCGVSIPKDGPLSPVKACIRMLEEAKTGQSSTRGIIKLMPLERICFGGNLEALKREARDLLLGKGLIVEKEEHAEKASGQIGLESERKAVDSSSRPTYMVSLCRRNYAAHSRDEIFKTLGDVIGGRWKVDLTCPDYVLLVEAIKGTIGVGICPRFIELKKYNLRQLQDEARKEDQALQGKIRAEKRE